MKDESIKEIYSKVKLKLPDFEKLDNEFEICAIEPEGFFLRNIRRKITDKFEFAQHFLDEIIQPESMFALIESKEFCEDDMEPVFEIYKKVMLIMRRNVELDIQDNDQKNAEFMHDALSEWESIKKAIIRFNSCKIKCWKNPATKPEKLGYLG